MPTDRMLPIEFSTRRHSASWCMLLIVTRCDSLRLALAQTSTSSQQLGDTQNGTVYRSDLLQCRKLKISYLRI